ncbi:MAG: M1 family aminopeptidase [candidate division KSB1 bacterium]|nr:M1 family aminopeptidase [candidate division KSB1 bacterium]MDZ7333548.1 M1 family aminopeptidase [candidate division KSB1 bacterium]MDZ7398662.1 M1 family aminopeptidase [candidate division KSB1 bacterium]
MWIAPKIKSLWTRLWWMFSIFFIPTILVARIQDDFDVFYYEIDVAIDPQQERIEGSVSVEAVSLVTALSVLELDLSSRMTVTAVSGNAKQFRHVNDVLRIDLDRTYDIGEPIAVTIFYHGKPSIKPGFNPMTFDRTRSVITISSESCPYYARYWWPCKDRPDDKPDSMDIKIRVPGNLIVASNGILIGVKDNGDGTRIYHWEVRHPIATYLVAITISNYHVIHDRYVDSEGDTLPIMHFIYPEHYNKALIDLSNIPQMIQVLESYYGLYPFHGEKVGVAQYVGYWGGMEYQTLVCIQPFYITGNYQYEAVLVHELAHQWWGDCITPKNFHHSWISEGFATFSEALYYGHIQGPDRYRSYMENENNAKSYKGIMYRHDISDPNQVYAGIVYYKGAWVLHMLRHVVGEQNFWAGLKNFRMKYQYGSATTEDLQSAFEEVIGASLEWFFHQWIYEPNYPHYCYGVHQEKQGQKYELHLMVRQEQTDAPLFAMPIDLKIATAASETTLTIMVADRLEKFTFTFPDSTRDIQFDPENWVLKSAQRINSALLRYVGHQVIDSTGNNNGLAEPGETVKLLVSITNDGLISRNITAWLSCDDGSVKLSAGKLEWAAFDVDYQSISNDLTFQFSFSVEPIAEGHLANFKLHLEADNGYSAIDSFDVKIGQPTIILIDDDDGADYERYFWPAASLAKIYCDSWEVKTQGVPGYGDLLQRYKTAIWFTGDDRTTSLTSEEQYAITEFLDRGGWLILTGQNIGYDLMVEGSTQDSLFFTNYLHAVLLSDSIAATMMRGESGDPIGQGSFVYIQNKAGCANNQRSPSAIGPRDGAHSFLKYIPQNLSAAIRYVDDRAGYRLIYLGFGFEGISGPYQDTAAKLLLRMLNWLSGGTGLKEYRPEQFPKQFRLEQNYPNPFNPMTRIRYQIVEPGRVVLSIYNLQGQHVTTLLDRFQLPGQYELSWDGCDSTGMPVASGVYIYRLFTSSDEISRKLALIR